MNDKDKMYILNDILGEVKPLYLRQRVGARFIEFVDNKIPDGSVVVGKKEREELGDTIRGALEREEKWRKLCDIKTKEIEAERKQAVKEFIQAITEDVDATYHTATSTYVDIDDIHHIAIDKFGVEL